MEARLLGREEEQRRIGALLGAARNGRGGALLLVGDPGIGKTSILTDAAGEQTGMTKLHAVGFAAESAIAYAGAARLLGPLRDRLGELPQAQQDALRVAAGAEVGSEVGTPTLYLVALGVLGLMSASGPTLCIVDDAHLLDPESLDVLAFAARRLTTEPIALLIAGRDEAALTARMAGVPVHRLGGLGTESAVGLLNRSVTPRVDPAVAVRIAEATGGNPLALVDLAHDLSAGELAGLHPGDGPVPLGYRLEAHYLRQVRGAPADVQRWILLAAADSTGDIDLISAAATDLGLPGNLHDGAEEARLVRLRRRVHFRHPLVQSAVYGGATGAQRRNAHRALARAAARLGYVEREAWHAAQAVVGTDSAVADRLERAADLAARRGGFASRAAVLSRAAELTPPGPARTSRLVAAAEAAVLVGAVHVAEELLSRLDSEVLGPVDRGRILMLRVSIGLFTVDPATVPRGAAMMVAAADCFHGHDPHREQEALVRAFELCTSTDRAMVHIGRGDLARRLTTGAAESDGPYAVALRGLGALMAEEYDLAVPLVRAALEAILSLPDAEMMQNGTLFASLATHLWDFGGRDAALERAVGAARAAGALQVLDTLLWIVSIAEVYGGSIRTAERAVERVRAVRQAMGYDTENVVNAAIMAWTGAPRAAVQAVSDGARAVGFGGVWAGGVGALAIRDLAEGHYRAAFERLLPLVEDPFLHVTPLHFADFVEAAVRSGHEEVATPYADRLGVLAEVNGSPWCRGAAERARALVSDAVDAERHYLASVEALERVTSPVELGRSRLVYGEWLRRAKRRGDARIELEAALAAFEDAGAAMFAARARAELEAIGAHPGAATDANPFHLTSQELTVARLAASGHTNAEIGATLFISPNTVDYHLRKVFQKVGVSSRRQLTDHLDHA